MLLSQSLPWAILALAAHSHGLPISSDHLGVDVPLERSTLPVSALQDGMASLQRRAGNIVQLSVCGVSATVAMFVSSNYDSSAATKVYIVQHGAGADPDQYYDDLSGRVDDTTIVIAPSLSYTKDAITAFHNPDLNLAWDQSIGTWTAGDDAVAPYSGPRALNGAKCSSFDAYDTLLNRFADRSRFPALQQVYLVGHSGGANTIDRYSQLYNRNDPFAVRFVVANAANHAYFTSARPEANVCDAARHYSYQLTPGSMNRYANARIGNNIDAFKTWIQRDVRFLIGQQDTNAQYPGGTQNCQSQAQGGQNRRDRNGAWWAYQNILAGTSTDVSSEYGYQQLKNSGAVALTSPSQTIFRHTNCVVPDIGHEDGPMFSSACGQAALA